MERSDPPPADQYSFVNRHLSQLQVKSKVGHRADQYSAATEGRPTSDSLKFPRNA
jgi:hypothetical protein